MISTEEPLQIEPDSSRAILETIEPSKGEALAKSLAIKCQGRPKMRRFSQAVTSNSGYNIMLCPMCKLASTFWTRFFRMLASYDNPKIETPYDIAIADAPPTQERLTYMRDTFFPDMYKNHYKFMFVRNPYSRILSAYVDKLFAPNPYFWKGICSSIIRSQRFPSALRRNPLQRAVVKNCGADLTFEEYLRAIVTKHKKPHTSVDCHDSEFHSYCHTCEIQYDFIGKMENFMPDSVFLYRKLGLNKTLNSVYKFSGLLDNDALYDTVSSAFEFKNDVIQCGIPWHQALHRVWRKLQIRGVIGKHPFPITAEESDKIDQDKFIHLVKETRLKTSSEDRRKQRKEALIEIYRSVPLDLLRQLRPVYAADFELFDYESSPVNLFNRTTTYIPFGYLSI